MQIETAKWFSLLGYATGDYTCKCGVCREEFVGDKRAMMCLPCAAERAQIHCMASQALRGSVEPLLEGIGLGADLTEAADGARAVIASLWPPAPQTEGDGSRDEPIDSTLHDGGRE